MVVNKMSKEDKEYLWQVLNQHHNQENSIDIEECPLDDCWYKSILRKLNIKKPDYRKNIKTKRDRTRSRIIRGG